MKRYLIVGDGVAGARAALKIKEADSAGDIRIFTDEAFPFYYRVRFPEMIAGEISAKDIIIHSTDFYKNKGISLHLEEKVIEGNADKKEVVTEKGKRYPYDLLLVTTGGSAFVPPIKGVDKQGVFTLRSMQDAVRFVEFMGSVKQAILVGGGLVGLETGGALLRKGIHVAVIEHNPRILPRQTDPEGAKILQERLEQMGFSFYLNSQSDEIMGKEKVEGLRLKDGRTIEAQMVILSAGVRPNTALAASLGLEVKNGILVDDQMRTKKESIFAAGDVAEHRGRVYGIWPAAQRQGETAGTNMAGGNALYQGTVMSNKLKVVGVDLLSVGEIDPEKKLECVVRSDRENGVYRKVAFKEDKIIGCVFVGNTKGGSEIQGAIEKKISVKELKHAVLEEEFDFGQLR